jgi:ribonuclease R
MEDKLGQEFEGMIISLTSSGMFVKLESGIEGFVGLKHLKKASAYDETQLQHYNLHGSSYQLGAKVKIELVNVDKIERQITFVLTEFKGIKNHENNCSKQKSQLRVPNPAKNRGRTGAKGQRSKVNKKR